MSVAKHFCLVTLALTGMIADFAAAEWVPEQYQDDYVVVRAGILEAGARSTHLGDVLTVSIQVDLDPANVRLESLDEAFFQRAFAGIDGLRGLGSPELFTEGTEDGRSRVSATWSFQILDCPNELVSCPGSKSYELPAASLSYQIIDRSGQIINSKSARFRVWPGYVAIAPSISSVDGNGGSLRAFFPAGAYPAPEAFSGHAAVGIWGMCLGGLILGTAFAAGRRRLERPVQWDSGVSIRTRWEQVYLRLQATDTPDDWWADNLRRCVIWFCQDELDRNPCAWFADGGRQDSQRHDQLSDWRRFFFDVLQLDGISIPDRSRLLVRFSELVGLPPPVPHSEGTP